MMDERLGVALVGAGLMGAYHGETLARRLPDARLVAVVDPVEAAARRLLDRIGGSGRPAAGAPRWERELAPALADPAVEAVVVATPGWLHADAIVAAAEAGKAVFCEKPITYTLEDADRALAAVERAGVPLQIGFQRRFDPGFRRARAAVADGTLGQVQLLRSITRDPERTDMAGMPPGTIFRDTLIHDFDMLRWLADSEAVEVFALADALIAPQLKPQGLLDTAVVTVRFANGALATADASFSAAYGYDVRAEVFGSDGMMTVGNGAPDTAWHFSRGGVTRPQVNWFLDLFGHAYVAELAHFVECVRTGQPPAVTGQDGRAALVMALAALASVETGRPVRV